MRIIKKLLEDNTRDLCMKLKYTLWVDRINTKRVIHMSPFQLVYRFEAVFPAYLGVSMMRLLQEQQSEPNHMQRRINHIIEFNKLREKSYNTLQIHQDKMNNTFDKKVKEENFSIDDLNLKWDAPHEHKGKHGKFDHMWVGPYIIVAHIGENVFILQHQDESLLEGGLVNGMFLEHYLT